MSHSYDTYSHASDIFSSHHDTVLWSFTIAATNVTENDLPMYTYVLTEMLIGILAPMLVIISGVLAAMIADYTTSGKVDPRDLISYILPSVTLFKGMNHCYWVIVDTFYFVTKKTKVQNYQGRCHWCSALDKSLVTCGLAAIVSLALMESFSTFASINVSVMVSYSSCETADIDISVFTCYDGKTWQNVNNCSLENGTSHIFCFQFVPARSVGTHSLDSLVASILVYVGFTHLFGLTFTVIGALLRCKATKVWGVIVVLVGITIFLCGFVQFILIFYYPVKYKPNETVQTNMLGIYIVVTGTLLMRIKWMEKPDDDKEVELHSIRLPKAERYRNVRATRRAKFSPDTEQFDCTTEKDTAGRPRNHLTVA